MEQNNKYPRRHGANNNVNENYCVVKYSTWCSNTNKRVAVVGNVAEKWVDVDNNKVYYPPNEKAGKGEVTDQWQPYPLMAILQQGLSKNDAMFSAKTYMSEAEDMENSREQQTQQTLDYDSDETQIGSPPAVPKSPVVTKNSCLTYVTRKSPRHQKKKEAISKSQHGTQHTVPEEDTGIMSPPTPIRFTQYSQSIVEPSQKPDCRKSLLQGSVVMEQNAENVPEWALDIIQINKVMTDTLMEISTKLDVVMSDQRKLRKELALTQKYILDGQDKVNLGAMNVMPNESMVIEILEDVESFNMFEREMEDKNVFQKHVRRVKAIGTSNSLGTTLRMIIDRTLHPCIYTTYTIKGHTYKGVKKLAFEATSFYKSLEAALLDVRQPYEVTSEKINSAMGAIIRKETNIKKKRESDTRELNPSFSD